MSSNFFDFCFFDILPVETGSYGASFIALMITACKTREKKKKNSERFFNEYYGIPDDAGEGMRLCSNDDLPGKFSIATYGTVLAGGTQ